MRDDGSERARIAEELFDGKDFFYSRDPSMTPPNDYWGSEFNAGFWGCANTTRGREIMDAWTKAYPVEAWSRGRAGSGRRLEISPDRHTSRAPLWTRVCSKSTKPWGR